jgi:DNA (cytosine-5)-methyltransferase 1
MHLYSEFNPYRAEVLRQRIAQGFLPEGKVDERSITDIPDEDFRGYAHVHLFAGIGGFPFGLRLAGVRDDFGCDEKHQTGILTGGFPCQDISNAGKRAGISGARSGLWREMLRAIRVVRPRIVLVENVAALLNRGMGTVLGGLADIGYNCEWDRISAASVGAPHLRNRIFIVAYASGAREWIESQRVSGCAVAPKSGDDCATGNDSNPTRERTRAIPEGWRGEGEGTRDVDRSGENVADTPERGFAMRGESSGRGGQPECGGEIVAHSEERAIRSGLCADESGRKRRGRSGNGGGAGDICDANGAQSPRFGEYGREILSEPESKRFDGASGAEWWAVEPNVGRVAHGIPSRVDRLAALGDAIVPQCVCKVARRWLVPPEKAESA